MIRIIEEQYYNFGDKHYIEAAGLSTDTKPTGTIITGSLFLEADTGKVFVFDETGDGAWTEIGG